MIDMSTAIIAVLVAAFFFFQAEDGIRDDLVTGVQTCALPISPRGPAARHAARDGNRDCVHGDRERHGDERDQSIASSTASTLSEPRVIAEASDPACDITWSAKKRAASIFDLRKAASPSPFANWREAISAERASIQPPSVMPTSFST